MSRNYPYLFTYLKGKEYITIKLVSDIMDKNFGINSDGLPGNDDCGTISGWFVFSALGFYPVCPASEFYQTGIPKFKKITVELNDEYYSGKQLVIMKDLKNRPKFFSIKRNKKDFR